MSEPGVHHQSNLNRSEAMEVMARRNFVWCHRPASLEEGTLELSTKLVEMVAAGARCLCYPNTINREALGEDYPFSSRILMISYGRSACLSGRPLPRRPQSASETDTDLSRVLARLEPALFPPAAARTVEDEAHPRVEP